MPVGGVLGRGSFALTGGEFKKLAGVVAALCVAAGVSGCSTVVLREPSPAAVSAPQRASLETAAAKVSATKWPKPDGGAFASFVGFGGGVSEGDAVRAYLGQLGPGPGRGVSVLQDAYHHVDAAYALAAAAAAAANVVDPTTDDVRLVEAAIGDLRGARNIYLASLRELADEGDGVEARTAQSLKGAFNDAIKEVGAAADTLSDHLVARRAGEADSGRRPVATSKLARFAG